MAVTATIKSFLKGKHICVPDEWITACVEWVRSENPGLNVSNARILNDLVYEQWLHADLTELGTCSLPFDLSQKKSISLSGHFVLQVNSVRDVGQPAYAQLQKVRQADNENAKVTAEQSHQPAWEPKPSRMLIMQLTDGTSVVQGMEYRTIPAINHNMKPGTKIIVSGNITSRRGMLLLTRENISVLGGEVESLLVANAMENVLARKLGSEETEQPQQFVETAPTQIPPSQASQYYPSQLNGSVNRSQNNRRGGLHQTTNNRVQNAFSAPSTAMDDMGDDDFLDADLEAALSQIESQATSSQSSSIASQQNRNAGNNRNNLQRGFGSNKSSASDRTSSNRTTAVEEEFDMDVDDAFFNDDFDDDIVLMAERQAAPHLTNKASQQNNSSAIRQSSISSSLGSSSQSRTTSQLSKAKNSKQPQAKQSNLKNFFTSSQESDKISRKPPTTLSKPIIIDDDDDDIMEVNSSEANNTSASTSQSKLRKFSATEFKTPLRPSGGSLSTKQDIKRKAADIVQQEPPFSYLCFLPERPSVRKDIVVKGFIMTLTSRLEQVDGKWKLTVIINDGTASSEVDIENQVLEGLIGMSVEEMNIKKAEARSNPMLKSQLGKAVGGCQRQLISLCSLLHISVFPGMARPKLTAITPFEKISVQHVAKRSSLFSHK